MYQYPKQVLTVTQLIQKLQDDGMTISSQDEATTALTTVGYYRLKGYSFHLIDPATKKYLTGTTFSDILRLYAFDMELSHLIFKYLSKVEVTLRAHLVIALQQEQDALILNDPSVFKDKKDYWKNQGSISSEIARSDDVFIKHNFRKHEGAVPLWAAVEVMSFGTLSKVIKNLNTGAQSSFSALVQNYKFKNANGNDVNPSKDMFTSWVQALSVMRNICAHNSRIYNRAISTRPQLIAVDRITPQPQYNGLYEIILSMKYLRPTDDLWSAFVSDLNQLLQHYNGVCDIAKLNFPTDWANHFQL